MSKRVQSRAGSVINDDHVALVVHHQFVMLVFLVRNFFKYTFRLGQWCCAKIRNWSWWQSYGNQMASVYVSASGAHIWPVAMDAPNSDPVDPSTPITPPPPFSRSLILTVKFIRCLPPPPPKVVHWNHAVHKANKLLQSIAFSVCLLTVLPIFGGLLCWSIWIISLFSSNRISL